MVSSAGFEMVIFFFVLSGFFIRYAQLRKRRTLLSFYLNRIVRIYPPYLASVGLAAIVLIILATQVPKALDVTNNRELNISLATAWHELQRIDFVGVIRTMFFVPVREMYIGYNHVFWSLLPEGLFYLAVPLAFWRVKLYYAFSVIAYILGLVLQYQSIALNPIITYLFIYNMYFTVGAMLYDIVIETKWVEWFRRVPNWVLLLVISILFVALLGLAILKLRIISGLVASLLATLCISTLLTGSICKENILIKLMHKIGVFSFSLYLYHLPLLLICYGVLVMLTGETVFYNRYYWLAVPLVTLMSYGLYWISERRAVNYFRKV